MLYTLKDETLIRIRPIRPIDKPALVAAHATLSAETVRRRYLTAKPRFSSGELRYLTEVDGWDHVALVATPVDEPERIIAVGRFVRLAEDPEAAEFAIVVGDDWQGRGVGTRVAEALVARAIERGIARFTATMLSDNTAVHQLIAHIATRLEYVEAGSGTQTLVAQLAA